MMWLVLIEVVSRYAIRSPLRVADEFSAYMYIAAVFIGAAYTWKEKGHVRIEVIASRLSPRAALWLRLVVLTGAVVFIPVVIRACYDLFSFSFDFGMRSGTWLRVPLGPVQVFMFIGLILLFVQVVVELIRTIQALRTSQGEMN
jgi:TRAP-type C4-dicarboxylate transport system permease small subunit